MPGSRPTSSSRRATSASPTWTVAPAPADLDDRRVEITGPAEPKMMINALNSGARVFMADLEDALSPTWANVVAGQAAIADATRGTLAFDSPEGKAYRLERGSGDARRPAARLAPHRVARARRRRPDLGVAVRLRDVPVPLGPRGDRGGERAVPVPRQARVAPRGAPLERGLRPRAGGARRSRAAPIRATVLIETILAAFEMDEILYELREHAAGLNAGRWDYLFSAIKKFRTDPRMSTPDRAAADDDRAVHARLHGAARPDLPRPRRARDRRDGGVHPEPARRGGHRDGPGQGPRGQGARERRRVRRDVGRPSRTWCRSRRRSSTASSGTARTRRSGPATRWPSRPRSCSTSPSPGGAVTVAGVRANIRVALAYLDSWLRGVGAAAIDNLMEDAATAEISRSQLWMWITQGVVARRRLDRRPGALRGDPRRGAGAARRRRRGPARGGRRPARPPRPRRRLRRLPDPPGVRHPRVAATA